MSQLQRQLHTTGIPSHPSTPWLSRTRVTRRTAHTGSTDTINMVTAIILTVRTQLTDTAIPHMDMLRHDTILTLRTTRHTAVTPVTVIRLGTNIMRRMTRTRNTAIRLTRVPGTDTQNMDTVEAMLIAKMTRLTQRPTRVMRLRNDSQPSWLTPMRRPFSPAAFCRS